MEVSIEKAFSILENNMLTNVMEIDNLKWAKDRSRCYLISGAIVIVIIDDKSYIRIIPVDAHCDYIQVRGFVEKYSNTSLTVNVTDENEKIVRDVFEKSFNYNKTIVDYGTNKPSTCNMNKNIRLLTKGDREAFTSMESESIQYRPPLNVLFSVFVEKGNGEILAFYDENKILGYISYSKLFDDVYDVDYIYVSPSQRQKGIGKALALSYVFTIQERKGIAYWSNAKNEKSEKTAISAGLSITRKSLIFN